jgi:hypothetical protein
MKKFLTIVCLVLGVIYLVLGAFGFLGDNVALSKICSLLLFFDGVLVYIYFFTICVLNFIKWIERRRLKMYDDNEDKYM